MPLSQPSSRAVSVVVTALAVASLLVLALRPTYVAEMPSRVAVLWTPGAAALEMPGEIPDDALLFAVGAAPAPPEARPIPDLAWLARHHPEVGELRVVGHGLREWEWTAMGEATVVEPRLEAPFDAGIREIDWPRRLTLGDRLTVRGALSDADTVRLEGPGGVVDEAAGDDGGIFRLHDRPRAAGRFLYRVVVERRGVRVAEETLDVTVAPPRPLDVLWLEDAPSFETRHFKTWLAERGGRLAVRSRISRERFRTEFQGFGDRPALSLSPLGDGLLERFDVVVVDPESLAALPSAEREVLMQQVSEGLGLLIRVGPTGEASAGFEIAAIEGIDELSVVLEDGALAGIDGIVSPLTVPPLTVAAREIVSGDALRPLLVDRSGRLLAATRPQGLGEVGVTLLDGTYRWRLEGRADAHGALWSALLGAVTRPEGAATRWLVPRGPLRVDAPVELTLAVHGDAATTPIQRVEVRAEDGSVRRLEAVEDPAAPELRRVSWWPETFGWHLFRGGDVDGGSDDAGAAELWLWAAPAASWATWDAARCRDATRRVARLRNAPAARSTPRRAPWPRWPSYAVFLLCVAYLWIVERRRPAREIGKPGQTSR